jgi:hypothetical protein
MMMSGMVRTEPVSSNREADDKEQTRKKPTPEQEQRFRTVLGESNEAKAAPAEAKPARSMLEESDDDSVQSGTISVTALYQPMEVSSSALPAVPTVAQDLRELLTNYADQILIGRLDARQGGEAVVSFAGVLPDTTMTLTRGASGWRLVARTGSMDAYRALTENADGLKAQFHARHLGELEISAELNDVDRRR